MRTLSLPLLGSLLVAAFASGCAAPARIAGVTTSEERRIWLVRLTKDGNDEVYRCADGAEPGKPPRPVCVRAPMVESPQ